MGFPSFSTSGQPGGNGSANPQIIGLPAYAPGDMFLVAVLTPGSLATQTSWTFGGSTMAFTQLWSNLGQSCFYGKYRVMQAGDTATSISVAIGNGLVPTCYYLVFRFAAGTFDPAAVPPVASPNYTYTSTPNPAPLGPVPWGVEDTLWLALATGGGVTLLANPSGYSGGGNVHGAAGVVAAASRDSAAASEDPGAFTFSGSTYSAVVTVAIKPAVPAPVAPVAAFSGAPLVGPAPLTVAFADASTNTPTAWDWDFGDGSAHGAAQNPSHTYAKPGAYTVTLTATNAGGAGTVAKVGYIVARGSTLSPPGYW